MNSTPGELREVLDEYLAVCRDLLELGTQESVALQQKEPYPAFEFHQKRKKLLPQLDKTAVLLRNWSRTWPRKDSGPGFWGDDVKALLDAAQRLVVKILVLDRENQQALLRRGLVPARYIPPAAAQRPHYVATLYQRQSPRGERTGINPGGD